MTWTPHLMALLAGIDDGSSVLSMLKGQESTLLRYINEFAIAFIYKTGWNTVEEKRRSWHCIWIFRMCLYAMRFCLVSATHRG